MTIGTSYLLHCKENYLSGIYPADPNRFDKEGYERLLKTAKYFFDNNLLNQFSEFLMEGNYLVQLWTAHFILELGKPDLILRQQCLTEIKKYADKSLIPEVASQEKKWLDNYFK